jgi:hypothetical protein
MFPVGGIFGGGEIMNRFTLTAFRCLAVVGLFLSIHSRDLADWPYDQFRFNWLLGDGYYGTYSQESVPYYALHPPVYYSHPVSRTYGLLPFPYVPETWPCQAGFDRTKTVTNQFVEQPADEEGLAAKGPLLVMNPFVERNEVSSQVMKASWETTVASKTKVIYPSKMASGG